MGTLSLQADDPETVSSICAVLAETDLINMVSRGISSQNILKGIHLSMAGRLIKLLKAIKVRDSKVLVTGGLARGRGLMQCSSGTGLGLETCGPDQNSHGFDFCRCHRSSYLGGIPV